MWIKDIELINFRNYKKEKFEFVPGINVIHGYNGQGKTNLIEAISYISTLSSFRNSKNDDVIKNEEDIGLIRCNTSTNQNIKISILKTNKNIIVDNEEIKRLRDYIGTVNVICFSSDDIVNFKDSPHDRRRFFDVELSKIDKDYAMNLIKFKKMLKQRNDVLKSKTPHLDKYLSVLDKQIVDISMDIYRKRKEFIHSINSIVNEEFKLLTNDVKKLEIFFHSDVDNKSVDDVFNSYQQSVWKDQEKGNTSFGIHKDDYECLLDGLDICSKCSSGQQRISLLSIKLAILRLVEKKTGKIPILILDDIFSELDEKKKKNVVKRIKDVNQIFITTTSVSEMEGMEYKYFRIEEGKKIEDRM